MPMKRKTRRTLNPQTEKLSLQTQIRNDNNKLACNSPRNQTPKKSQVVANANNKKAATGNKLLAFNINDFIRRGRRL